MSGGPRVDGPAPAAGAGAGGMLAWMQANAGRLADILREEAGDADDLSPAGAPAIRGHLRFVAEAVAAALPPGASGAVAELARDLPDRLTDRAVQGDLGRVAEAAEVDASFQFGERAGEDPALRPHLDRTARLEAWSRAFLRELDAALPDGMAVAGRAQEWMAAHQERLANTIFAMDRRAKQAEIARGGPDAVASPAVVNRIGHAVVVQARTRFLVEALEVALTGTPTAT